MNIACIKVDLAKQVFQVHGVDRTEKVLTRAIAPIADAGLFQQIDAMWECALLLGAPSCHWLATLRYEFVAGLIVTSFLLTKSLRIATMCWGVNVGGTETYLGLADSNIASGAESS